MLEKTATDLRVLVPIDGSDTGERELPQAAGLVKGRRELEDALITGDAERVLHTAPCVVALVRALDKT